MTEGSSPYFQLLNDDEKASKLALAVKAGSDVTVWEKGSKERASLLAAEFVRADERLLCSGSSDKGLSGKEVLFSFEANGLSFFGGGELKKIKPGLYALQATKKLYKNERRANFRLLTFPHHKVYLHIAAEEEETAEGNVVGIKSGVSQTGLFKNFLKLIGGSDEAGEKEGHISFRVLDLSVSGAALQVGELESGGFAPGSKTGPLVLEFNGEEEEIQDGEVVYNIDMIPSNNGQRLRKAGIKFLRVDTNQDQRLAKLINSALRDFESEFEDFIK